MNADTARRRLRRALPMLALGGLSLWKAADPRLPIVCAQSQSLAASQRVVDGKVLGSGDTPLEGAIVYLKNTKTLEVRTFISTKGGAFRFGQLSMDTDYSLWAEYQGKKSKDKTISSFDARHDVNTVLKIDSSK